MGLDEVNQSWSKGDYIPITVPEEHALWASFCWTPYIDRVAKNVANIRDNKTDEESTSEKS